MKSNSGLNEASLPSLGPEYRIIRRMKRGGMAEILEAYRIGFDGFERRVAIKRPLSARDPEERAAFADEARILSRLDHRGVIAVFDLRTEGDWPYHVMEFVDGVDLSGLLERARAGGSPIDPLLACYVVMLVAEALQYVHLASDEKGRPLRIVHRDVSPQNILVSWSGDVKLIDFGIAFAERRRTRTQKGLVKGKLSFMAPEQRRGDCVSPATDIFGLGCVLAFLLLGESPVARALGRDLEKSELLRLDDLPVGVRDIVRRAIRTRPKDRFASAYDMALACRRLVERETRHPKERMQRWLASLPQTPRAPSLPAEASRSTQRSRKAVIERDPAEPPAEVHLVPKVKLASSELVALFFTEAAMFSHARHENLLRVLEFGAKEDDYFLIVERPRGFTVGQLLEAAGGRLDPSEVAALALGLCEGLAAARSLPGAAAFSSIRRAIGFDSVLITEAGQVKIGDYARCTSAERAPGAEVDEVRSLAEMLWTALTGTMSEPMPKPRDADSMESIVASLHHAGGRADLGEIARRARAYLEASEQRSVEGSRAGRGAARSGQKASTPEEILGDLVRSVSFAERDAATYLARARPSPVRVTAYGGTIVRQPVPHRHTLAWPVTVASILCGGATACFLWARGVLAPLVDLLLR